MVAIFQETAESIKRHADWFTWQTRFGWLQEDFSTWHPQAQVNLVRGIWGL